jgi:hypothetical protein
MANYRDWPDDMNLEFEPVSKYAYLQSECCAHCHWKKGLVKQRWVFTYKRWFKPPIIEYGEWSKPFLTCTLNPIEVEKKPLQSCSHFRFQM